MFGWLRRNKKKSLGFKETSKAFDKEIRDIKKIKDESQRLAEYRELLEDIDSVFTTADDDIQRASEPADTKKDGIAAYSMSLTFQTMFVLGGLLLPPLYSIPAIAPYFLFTSPAAFAVAGAIVLGARHMLYRGRAKELGMSVSDVKYAQKIKKQQMKVTRAIKGITEFEAQQAEKEKLDALREKFAAKAVQKKTQTGNTPVSVASVTTSVSPTPASAPTEPPPIVEAQAQAEAPVKASVPKTVPKMARAQPRTPQA